MSAAPLPQRSSAIDAAAPVERHHRALALEAHGLVKRHGDVTALDGVDVEVPAGASLAVTGASGSGKSTLLYCLAGVVVPDEGTVALGGVPIEDLPERTRTALRRTRAGFVLPFGGLLPELTAEENVALPLMLGGTDRGPAVRTARRWFGPLGLEGLQACRPGQLSGGQEQRVAIARALVTGPSVVFADEPTGALDTHAGAEVMRLLTAATASQGAALVVVTHDPRVAAACDQQLAMVDGRVGHGAVAGATW